MHKVSNLYKKHSQTARKCVLTEFINDVHEEFLIYWCICGHKFVEHPGENSILKKYG